MASKKKKKASKKVLQKFAHGGAAKFIRKYPKEDYSGAAVVEAAAKAGYEISQQTVYNTWAALKKTKEAKAEKKKTKAELNRANSDFMDSAEDFHTEMEAHSKTKESAAGSYKSGYRDGYGDGFAAGLAARK